MNKNAKMPPDRESQSTRNASCCSSGHGDGLPRREFLKIAGLGAASSTLTTPLSAMAGPFTKPDPQIKHFVPADKKLSDDWVRSLFAKGEPEVYRGKDLATLAMPIGGIGTGQLYLLGDGTLGCWQVFNKHHFSGHGQTSYEFRTPESPVDQGFAVVAEVDGRRIGVRLRHGDFPDAAFRGEYPIGRVRYPRDDLPIEIEMEAFSPFIPLNAKDSSLPATIFHITVENTGDKPVKVNVLGWLENAVCCHAAEFVYDRAQRRTRIINGNDRALIVHTAEELPEGVRKEPREPIVLADFEGDDYGDWKVEGEAFGTKPARGGFEPQKDVVEFEGRGLANSFTHGDQAQGKLTSPPFEINRKFINFKIGGGRHPKECCVNLVIDGKVVCTATGENKEELKWHTWTLARYAGKQGQIEIIDRHSGGWGHVNADHIELSDEPRLGPRGPIDRFANFGSMTLALAGAAASAADTRDLLATLSELPERMTTQPDAAMSLLERYCAALATPATDVAPQSKRTFTFVLSWHFPNRVTVKQDSGHMYANWFTDAGDAARYVLDRQERLTADTRKWRDTYYDSTLPIWLLNRLHSTVSNLATGTAQWWKNGRFWAWEGVFCCQGTCTHVWNYAHALALLFPGLERSARQMQDLGVALHEDGLVGFRGNKDWKYAADGQAGTVLKCYREHRMSPDDAFLKRNWAGIRKALEFSIGQDENDDGLIEKSQHNTFDINFFGPNTFVGSLYLAALRAGEEMAKEIGDIAFARRARAIFESGSRLYFFQLVDLQEHPKHQYGQGCLSDQVFGQGWAEQLGLGYLYPRENVRKALESVWRYNWAPDIAEQNAEHKPWRWFVSPGEAGLFTCTWPKSEHLKEGVLYRDEVWTGIEYQVAGHMIWEGMLTEALAICRAIHDRYHPAKHNPYNEVECGDHYARALASWGVFTALAGYEYHGPKGCLAFAPSMTPEHFRSAFTAAEGWGTFEQKREDNIQKERIGVRWGRLRLKTLAFTLPDACKSAKVKVKAAGKRIDATCTLAQARATVTLAHELTLNENEELEIDLTY